MAVLVMVGWVTSPLPPAQANDYDPAYCGAATGVIDYTPAVSATASDADFVLDIGCTFTGNHNGGAYALTLNGHTEGDTCAGWTNTSGALTSGTIAGSGPEGRSPARLWQNAQRCSSR